MDRLAVGFLMDPLSQVQPHHDTTFALMVEAARRGHPVFAFEQQELGHRGGRTWAPLRRLHFWPTPDTPFAVTETRERPLSELDVLFLRKDPPVDEAFLHATLLVELCGERTPLFVNSPRGLRDANEKLWALQLPDLCPPTWISADPRQLRAFLDEVSADAVLKPLDGHGGRGVVRLRRGDPNVPSLLELLTSRGTRPALVQAYLPASRDGDKRILVLDGEPLGAVLRVPREDDLRANLAQGGRAERAPLTQDDRKLCAALAPSLRAHGLWLVGLDVIGGKLTEVNVTSPTGLQEIDALDGVRLEARIMDWVERRARARAS